MKLVRMIRNVAVALAVTGMVLPHPKVMADGLKSNDGKESKTVTIHDVALAEGGVLNGVVRDAEGNPLNGAAVAIRQGNEVIASTISDENGEFIIEDLNGGVYVVNAGQSQGVYRLWTEDTAPPSAQTIVDMVSVDEDLVRGQYPGLGGLDVFTLVTLGTAIAGVTLAAINLGEINDLEDKVDQLLASP
ncbi:MAG: carboxypeptidase-like regulatory domain-containing protein [Planctomycetota bacterium]|nr:carboxypeptidase-like regulatory domain-containing protein [Planctomycetota bacterium]